MTAHNLLGNALIGIWLFKNSLEMVSKEVTKICAKWGISGHVTDMTKEIKR